MQDLKLIRASAKDVDTINRLAILIWNQYYIDIISQNQINYMLDLMYSPKNLSEKIINKNEDFYLIQKQNNYIGFLSVQNKKENSWFLNKFYINQDFASNGFGSKILHELKEMLSIEKLRLTVNRQNFKSINFYFKNGFKIDHVEDFDIGNGFVMNDFVMLWENKKY